MPLIHRRIGLVVFLLAAVSLVGGARAQTKAAPLEKGKLLRVAQPIPNQYIVVLNLESGKTGLAAIQTTTRDLLTRYGGQQLQTYQYSIQGFAAKLTGSQAKAMAADSRVKYVEQDGVMTAFQTQTNPPWGLDRIDQRALPLNNTYSFDSNGSGVHVYVIDGGIRVTHTDFGGRASGVFTAINDGHGADDGNGHGTHVAGTVGATTFGVAKGVQIHAVRVFPFGSNTTTNSNTIAGVDWVTGSRTNPAVANMSLGGAASQAVDDAVRASIRSGVTYVVAAGNSNANACDQSPARVAEAITVGSTDMTDTRASSSNFGSCVDLFAPGVGVLSTFNTSDTATATLSGTSMASPHVAGEAARLLQLNPGLAPAAVAQRIVELATPSVVQDPQPGSPNLLLFGPTSSGLPFTGQLDGVVHLQDIGDQPLHEFAWAGTKGESRRLEGFSLQFARPAAGLSLEYMCHLQDFGDQPWMPAGNFCGTRGQSRRLEGFAIRLTGANAGKYDVFYQCHLEGIGDTGPVQNGAFCGTRGESRRLEAMNVWVTPKSAVGLAGVIHLQDIGDRAFRNNELAGTRGESRRLEGFSVNLSPPVAGLGLEYTCHLQDLGDQPWMPGGSFCGTRGESRRLEGFAVRLTGSQASAFDVYYLCHVEGIGDMGPFKNGDFCGTKGRSLRLEALYIWVAPKF
jgi:hypothetical protein